MFNKTPYLIYFLAASTLATCAFSQAEGTLSPSCRNCRQQQPVLERLRENQSNEVVSETDLLLQLDKTNRNLYNSLDSDGRELARRLASSSHRSDKNLAVKVASQSRQDHKEQMDRNSLQNGYKSY